MDNKKLSRKIFAYWQIPLAIAFFCFGYLIIAQYRTQVAASSSLEAQTLSDLTTIAINLSTNRDLVARELSTLQSELENIETKVNAGLSLTATLENQIYQMEVLTGSLPVQGSGISVSIASTINLLCYDIIDIVNELFASGAEAVSINDVRLTAITPLIETTDASGMTKITINGVALLTPITIKAVGDPETLHTGLTFPGGIITTLNTLYKIYPVIKQEEVIQIPAIETPAYMYMDPSPVVSD
jgi:uncharacterized protein YlxW (UPF0749 family)